MHDHDGEIVLALQLPEIRQQLRDISRVVLVSTMEPHQRIKHEQARLDPADGLVQPESVALEIEPDARGGDDVDRNVVKIESAMPTEPLEALAHECGMILGEINEDIARLGDPEPIEAGCCGRDRECEVESEPRLAELWAPPYETDGGSAPQLLDEPEGFALRLLELSHATYRQLFVHDWTGTSTSSIASSRMCSSTKLCSRS
jgi:hypothetical protein